jgi:hypothetical protein
MDLLSTNKKAKNLFNLWLKLVGEITYLGEVLRKSV